MSSASTTSVPFSYTNSVSHHNEQLLVLLDQAPAAIAVVHGPDHIFTFANPLYQKIFGRKAEELIGRSIRQVWPEIEGQGIYQIFQNVFTSGIPFKAMEYPATFLEEGTTRTGYYEFVIKPIRNQEERITDLMVHANEVTAQVNARKKAEDSEAYFRKMANTMPFSLWITEKEGTCSYLNNQWYELTGQSPEEALGTGWLQPIHPDDRQQTEIVFIESHRKQDSFSVYYRLRYKDGSYRWVHDYGKPRYDENGNFCGFIGAIQDVHEQRVANDKLVQSEARYRHIFEGSPVSIWEEDFSYAKATIQSLKAQGITDLKFYFSEHKEQLSQILYSIIVKDVNEASLRMMEAASKEELKRGLSQIFVEDTTDALIGELATIAAGGGFFEYVTKLKTLKGNVLDALVHITFPFSGDYSSVMVTLVDITESRKNQEKIKESEEHFRTLAESLPQLVWMTDGNGNQEYASQKWKDFTGIEPTGWDSWLQIIHPGDLKSVTQAWEHSRETGTLYQTEVRLKDKNGTFKWHVIQGEPLYNEQGTITKWIGSLTDIHDRKTFTERLEKEVEERTKELQRSNEDLQQFAHVASHDLKEPVRKVMTFSNRLKNEFSTELPARAHTYLSKIEDAAIRMYSMIDGVLLYSSLNALEQTKELIDLNEVIDNIQSDLELPITTKQARILVEELPAIEGSSILIYQLFYNLINNSLKFAKADTPLLIKLGTGQINAGDWERMNVSPDKQYMKLVLQDNGIGFDNKDAEKIFTSFTRLHAKDKYEGTGLGLSLCKKIVERHNGCIVAEGKEGEGARFTILLPA